MEGGRGRGPRDREIPRHADTDIDARESVMHVAYRRVCVCVQEGGKEGRTFSCFCA